MKRASLLILLLLPIITLMGQSVEQETSKRQQLEREIELLDKQLSEVKSKHSASMRQLTLIKRRLESRKSLLKEISKEIEQLEVERRKREEEIKRINDELDHLTENYKKLIYTAYKNRDRATWVLHILASKSIEQGFRREAYLRNFSKTIKDAAIKIKEHQEILLVEKGKLDSLYQEGVKAKKEKERELTTLAKEERGSQQVVNSLKRRERQFRNEIAGKRREVERLNRQIERILAAATKEAKRADKAEIEASIALSNIFEENRGKLPWPVSEGVIIEGFGQHSHPLFRHIKLPFNNGVNISTSRNAEVRTIFEGVVKQILVMPGYNQCVLVQHGNYYTFYTKLEKVIVTTGESLNRGDSIGHLVESEGGSVIHFQLWHGTTKQDPQKWLIEK